MQNTQKQNCPFQSPFTIFSQRSKDTRGIVNPKSFRYCKTTINHSRFTVILWVTFYHKQNKTLQWTITWKAAFWQNS